MSRRVAFGLLLLLAALLPVRAEASRTSGWESKPHASFSVARTEAASALASLAPAAAADAEAAEHPLFDLGDVVLADTADADAEHFGLGPLTLVDLNPLRGPPPSYPETRVGGFELLPPFRVGASASLSLWPRQACGAISCGLVTDSPEDPWGLESGQTFSSIDKRDRGYVAPPTPPLTPQQKAAAQQALIGCSVVAGGVGVGVAAGPSVVGAIAGFGAAWEGGPDCILGAIGFFSGENRESPLTEARRDAVYSDLKGAGVEITPAVGEEAEAAVARMQAASVTAFSGFGAMAPAPNPGALRTDGSASGRFPRAPAPAPVPVKNPRGTTRLGVTRENPSDWRGFRNLVDEMGQADMLSPANRRLIAGGRTPIVDPAWQVYFPEAKVGEKIPMHHIGGYPITVPLTEGQHFDAHMPGGYARNPGGPGANVPEEHLVKPRRR